MTSRRHTIFRRVFLLLFLLPFALKAQPAPETPAVQEPPVQTAVDGETTIVDYYGDLMTKRPGDTVLYLIDNVIFHHNGTYIQCDSAKRYDDYRMECFGNVLIAKDSTYIYGDRASYDGHTDIAKVYSPLLKLVNGDATMWVFNYMEFNTRTNIGEYNEGAVITQRDNLMESDRGFFNGDSSTITFAGHVAMRNDNYRIRTDSVSYHLDDEVVTFLTRTYIWDKDRDFLTAERGNYVRSTETYHFTRNAYAMTADQEFWADTMDYESAVRRVILRRDIQILDTAQRAIGLGDFGFYDDSLKNGMLTDNPAVIFYDTVSTAPDTVRPAADTLSIDVTDTAAFADGADTTIVLPIVPADTLPGTGRAGEMGETIRPDSAFARADTIFFHSYPPGKSKPKPVPVQGADTLAIAQQGPADSLLSDSLPARDSIPGKRTIGVEEPPAPVAPDSVFVAAEPADRVPQGDSLALLLPPADSTGQKKDTLERVIRGRQNVKLWRSDAQGVCDSLTAYSVDSMASLFGRPLIWNGASQLSADRIDIYSRNEKLDYAEFIGSPFITQQVEQADTLFNQAQGRLLQAWFRDNEIDRAIMTGNVLNYYYMGDDSLPPDKFAVLSCASLTIDFEDQEPVHMTWGGQGDWHIDPIDKIPAGESQRLPDFSWEPERRPKSRYDITLRTVRPSRRFVVEGYAQPVFPVEERFDATHESLLGGGTWRDRNELLDDNRVVNLRKNDLLY